MLDWNTKQLPIADCQFPITQDQASRRLTIYDLRFTIHDSRLPIMTTAIIHHPVFQQHDTGPGHPENPSRYSVVMNALRGDEQLWAQLLEIEAHKAPRGEIQACHAPQMYKTVERVVSEGTGFLRWGHGCVNAIARCGASRKRCCLPGNRGGDEGRGCERLCTVTSGTASRRQRYGILSVQ